MRLCRAGVVCGPTAARVKVAGGEAALRARRTAQSLAGLAAGAAVGRRDRRLTAVKRVLLTGMSGTGKSSVIGELAALGYKAIDTDDGWCEPLPGGRQQWREDAIAALLDTEDADILFIAGCEENQVRFHS